MHINRFLPSLTLLSVLALGCSKPAANIQPKALRANENSHEMTPDYLPSDAPDGSDWSQYHVDDATLRQDVMKSTLPANAGQIARQCLEKAFQVDPKTNVVMGDAKGAGYECGIVKSSVDTLEISFRGHDIVKHEEVRTSLYLDYDWKKNTYRLSTQKEKPASLLTPDEQMAQEKLEGKWAAGPHEGIDNRLGIYSAAEIQNPNTVELKRLAPIGKALAAEAHNPVVQNRFGS